MLDVGIDRARRTLRHANCVGLGGVEHACPLGTPKLPEDRAHHKVATRFLDSWYAEANGRADTAGIDRQPKSINPAIPKLGFNR